MSSRFISGLTGDVNETYSLASGSFDSQAAWQQHLLLARAIIARSAPIIVRAILVKLGAHQVNTITNTARIKRHQHGFMIPSWCKCNKILKKNQVFSGFSSRRSEFFNVYLLVFKGFIARFFIKGM